LVPQLSRAISSRRESARRRAEAFAAAQRQLYELRARVEEQAAELRARDEELERHREQIRSLEDVVEGLRGEIREAVPTRNGTVSHDEITSLLASEAANGEVARPSDAVARHLAEQDDRELAEIFDTALRTWGIRDRLGAYEEADEWRRLALATVHEASRRPAFNGAEGEGKRRLRGRLMRHLADACAAHTLRS
jgi:chromosome segregation ATPase